MESLLLTSLSKVFSDERPTDVELSRFSMLKNERSSFQLAVCPQEDICAAVEVGGFDGAVNVYCVSEVPVKLTCFKDCNDDYYLRKTEGLYPDVLEPVKGDITLKKGLWQSIWVELEGSDSLAPKEYSVTVGIKANGKVLAEHGVEVEVINALLPEQKLIYTNWYHCDAIANYYGVEVLSDEFWRINENFIREAVHYGVNMLLTPLFTPPLDTAVGGERLTVQLVGVKYSGARFKFDFANLKKWIDMCRGCGIKYFEMSHLFTQWGAKHAPKIVACDKKGREKKIFGWKTRTHSKEYDSFLRQFAQALCNFIDKEGLRDKCYFHVSDEPTMSALKNYKRRAALINELFEGFPVIDALSDFEFYKKGAVRLPIPNTNHIENFYGRVPELWAYYCCGQGYDYLSNRFMAMPSQRTRVIGCQLYKYDVKGFLQWGYNFYNTRYSKKAINPYEVTDAGEEFPSGDSFVVYPAKDGTALPSLRFKVFYDGLQDLRALQLLEKLVGREKALALIDADLQQPLSFTAYPHSIEWQLELRERINAQIKANI